MQSAKKQESINSMLTKYLFYLQQNKDEDVEMEIKFGTAKTMKSITKIQFNKVIERLVSLKFKKLQEQSLLRINNEYIDNKTGRVSMSKIRCELSNLSNIQKYCETDSISNLNHAFVLKENIFIDDAKVNNYDNTDFNFRASINKELNLTNSDEAHNIITYWNDSKKTFRYLTRNTFVHDDLPFKIDISVVKNSRIKNKNYVPQYKFKDSGTLTSYEKYEIEIELNNDIIKQAYLNNIDVLENKLKKAINIILSGLQNSNYPISYTEQNDVLQNYMSILWKDKYDGKIYNRHFIGPSSYTLQLNNIIPNDETSKNNTILNDYTVTDKADGQRKMLFINNKGGIYFIDTNMNVQFTGTKTNETKYFNSILDGELILHNKHRKFINLYAAFDIYYINGEDIRTYGFYPSVDDDKTKFRIPLLNDLIKNIKPYNINKQKQNTLPIRFEVKNFEATRDNKTIFQACKNILDKINNNLFEYETDGLIFTPSRTGVGSNQIGKTSKLAKITWEKSFKWKPSEFNTIDFLVSTEKNNTNDDIIKNIFKDGSNFNSDNNIIQYKSLILRVGFSENKHGYINPCGTMLADTVSEIKDNRDEYKPVRFYPTNPSDDNAGITNIILHNNSNNNKIMLTENNEIIEDNTIVEFKYDTSKQEKWRWVPLRVRYDKTADLRSGNNNFGNAYHVANSNWSSIHNPITVEMLTTGKHIPDNYENADIYYNRIGGYTGTKSLRDFHNLYVKTKLIKNVSKPGMTLIDLAVGKGGDISKWINSKLSFVLGIDVSRDNIENRMDGACARYLNYQKKHKVMPKALFVHGDTSKNIKSGESLYSDKSNKLVNAIFGIGAKSEIELQKNIYNNFGIAKNGFDVCSIQFAIHYMFENIVKFNNLLRNVSSVTKIGGTFIGTTYDGQQIFNMFKNKQENESISIIDENKKLIWKITKRYNISRFDKDNTSIGLAIDVYQESINKTFREYLVNFDYLESVLFNYGFIKLSKSELLNTGFKQSIGNFKDLFLNLEDESKINVRNQYGQSIKMSNNEKTISFLNKYFIFKKIRDVNLSDIYNNEISKIPGKPKQFIKKNNKIKKKIILM